VAVAAQARCPLVMAPARLTAVAGPAFVPDLGIALSIIREKWPSGFREK